MLDEQWQIVGIVGGLVVAGLAVNAWLTRSGEKALSIREHDAYKEGMEKQIDTIVVGQHERLTIKNFDDWRIQFRHDVDRLETTLREMNREMTQRVESREMVQTAQAKHDELQRAIARLQSQLDELQSRISKA